MKKNRALLLLFFLIISFAISDASNLVFRENKGQISDGKGVPNNEILYSCESQNMVVHFQKNSVKYQLNKTITWKEEYIGSHKVVEKIPYEIDYYSIDINWVGANPKTELKGVDQIQGIENFYNDNNINGILNVRSFKKLIYQNIYDGIDIVWYKNGKNLKYDYVLTKAADYKKIKLKVTGSKPSINRKGQLVFKTELGNIIEDAPIVFQNNKQLKAKWVIKDNIIEFEIQNFNPNESLIIDPALLSWGTFYGGTGEDVSVACEADEFGYSYICGYTKSAGAGVIATPGGFLTTLLGGLASFIAKFDSLGVRQWGTYLGQSDGYISSLKVDSFQNIYFAGSTIYGSGYSSIGSYQSSSGGNGDAFLGKFDKNGIRLWSTYYGGASKELGSGLSLDKQGNILICGVAYSPGSTSVLTSLGCHQNIYGGGAQDGWLAKFDNNGNRIWGTFLGGEGSDLALNVSCDSYNNIYVSGGTASTTGISTPGSYLMTLDTIGGFLEKFNPNGSRIWGTYCNGATEKCMAIDLYNNIFLYTRSATPPYTRIHKFNSGGNLIWNVSYGTPYYNTQKGGCATDNYGNVYISGSIDYTDNLNYATVGSYQTQHSIGISGPYYDGYLAKFNGNGEWKWGTFFGNSFGSESIEDCAVSGQYVFVCGRTNTSSSDTITTLSAHQTTYGGGIKDGFLAKFYQPCIDPTAPMVSSNTTIICEGEAVTINLGGNLNSAVNWYFSIDSCNGTIVDSTMAHSIQLSLTQTTTYYIKAGRGCITNPTICESITITVNPKPIVTITASSDTVCSGESSVQLNVAGAVSYLWFNGDTNTFTNVTPINSGYYTVNSTGSNGCSWRDSIYVYTHPSYLIPENKLLCNGLAYVWHGNTYTVAGIYYDSLVTINGCDSVYSLNLSTTTTQYTIHDTATFCPGGSYIWHGNTYNSQGTYYDYLTTYYGCDSTHILHLSLTTINNTVTVSGNTISSNETTIGTTYQWIDCVNGMSPISFENNQALNVTWSGVFAVQINLNGCVAISPCTPVTMIGVNEIVESNDFYIYPNPSNGTFIVEVGLDKFQKGEFIITDNTGREIGKYKLNRKKTQINIQELSNGIYFYSFIMDEEVKTTGKLTILK